MKILYILNQAKRVNNFSFASMTAAKNLGWEFHIAGNWSYNSIADREADEKMYGIKIFQVDFERLPYSLKNIKAYNTLKKIVKENNYDVIHCNTPTGGVFGRLVGKKYKVNKVIYEAHGFHFYKGASKKNWFIYYNVEKWLAKKTDCLVTINKEDYNNSLKFKLKKGGTYKYVHGVGINTDIKVLTAEEKLIKRKELGFNEDDFIIISAGDVIKRKNYKTAIYAMAQLKNDKIHYCICGVGNDIAEMQKLTQELNLEKRVHFLNYRSDIQELLSISNLFLISSYQEGLPRSVMEAMTYSLPVVASLIRGNTELIENGKGGFLCNPDDIDGYAESINKIAEDKALAESMGKVNAERVKDFSTEVVIKEMEDIYSNINN